MHLLKSLCFHMRILCGYCADTVRLLCGYCADTVSLCKHLLSVQTIVTDFNASPTDDARDLVNAAQVMLTGERQDVRNLCEPWGVHLTAQKSIAP